METIRSGRRSGPCSRRWRAGRYSSPEWWMSARPFWARREHFLR
nr:MAG TPA_asm: hypothetical protein [Caudoviricetes sp.]